MEQIKDKKCFYTPIAKSLDKIFPLMNQEAKHALTTMVVQIEVLMISEVILDNDYKFIKNAINNSWKEFKLLSGVKTKKFNEETIQEIKNLETQIKNLFKFCDEKYLRRPHIKANSTEI